MNKNNRISKTHTTHYNETCTVTLVAPVDSNDVSIVHDQWTRFDRLSPDKFVIAIHHTLHQAKKNADGDCKLEVERL